MASQVSIASWSALGFGGIRSLKRCCRRPFAALGVWRLLRGISKWPHIGQVGVASVTWHHFMVAELAVWLVLESFITARPCLIISIMYVLDACALGLAFHCRVRCRLQCGMLGAVQTLFSSPTVDLLCPMRISAPLLLAGDL